MENEIYNYTEYLFTFALGKCKNLHDAEDLTQDTLLAAYQYIHKGGEIRNMKYWLTSTLSHKWNDMLRKKYKLPTVSIDMISDNFEDEIEADIPNAEQVRREVAYLSRLQREVIIRHYLQGERVQDIADSLGVPKGTVLSRLSSGREQMRKGFNEMESYDKQSYRPERLDISCHGCQGFHDEPWSLVAGDLMKQNILIAAYEKPISVVEISRSLGIPTAYVERAVNDLVSSELMARSGNKVFTDFMITTPGEKLRSLDIEIGLVENNYSVLLGLINEYLDELSSLQLFDSLSDSKQKKLKYYFILRLFSKAIYEAVQRIIPCEEEYPLRPDGGRWIAVGSRYPEGFDFDSYRFGKYCYGGERGSYWEGFLNSKSIDLKVYDTQPDLNLYQHGPIELSDDDLAKLLYIISREIPFENTGFNLMLCEDIPHLIKCGVLGEGNGKVFVNIPILTPDGYGLFDAVRLKYMNPFADILEPLLREVFPKFKIAIPKHLEGRVAEFRQYSCYAIPMAFIKKASALGDFDDRDSTPPMVFVVDDVMQTNS
ncbi:MAG: RNA polymerase sigma factor [Ruminococcaceae bacterium]|nr:RNA polymerase sigma factor [Oscillospiraceae bacterium]